MSQDKKELMKARDKEAGFSIMSTELNGATIDTLWGPEMPSVHVSQLDRVPFRRVELVFAIY